MAHQLQYYYAELKRRFQNDLRSEWEVNRGGRRFLGFSVDSNSILADVEIENIRKIVGDDYSVVFQPNSNKIYIQ